MKKLIATAKDIAKKRTHKEKLKANKLCQNFKVKISQEHYFQIQEVTEKLRDRDFLKKKKGFFIISMNCSQDLVKKAISKLYSLQSSVAELLIDSNRMHKNI